MGLKPHNLTEYFIVLQEKANKCNKYAVCKACVRGTSYAEAVRNKITNKRRDCKRHLENCSFFLDNYPDPTVRKAILEPEIEDNKIATDRKCHFNCFRFICLFLTFFL